VLALTAAYARDPMGKGSALAQEALDRLIDGLKRHPTTLIFLAYLQGQAAGIATCFLGFSTFFARPLLNIHDFAILPQYRGRGLGRHLLRAVEAKALELGCCKITLEVQEKNVRARRVYERAGFAQALLRQDPGGTCPRLTSRRCRWCFSPRWRRRSQWSGRTACCWWPSRA